MMRKIILIPLILVSALLFIAYPNSVAAQSCSGNCCGTVRDTDGQPLGGVTITLRDSLGNSASVSTGGTGGWLWDANFPPETITFSKEGYRDSVCYTAPGAPGGCGGSGTTNCENIQTQLQSEDAWGWECVDPATNTCEPVIGGPFDTEEACMASCWSQRYRCYDSACVPCGISETNCPYSEPTCNNECPIAPPPPPVPGGCDDGAVIQTAIGPINVCSPQDFVASILKLAIGIGGGIAMLLIIFGGIQVLTSGGSPEKIQAGKELITSAIAGLLLIVFSVFILRIIGVEVLEIFE